MKRANFPLWGEQTILLPDFVDVLKMPEARPVEDPRRAVEEALARPIGTPDLPAILRGKGKPPEELTACLVISDNTRPVPYKGEGGILWPVIRTLLAEGLEPRNILVLAANGMHAPMAREVLGEMLDPRVFQAGVRVENHLGSDEEGLAFLGKTSRGSRVLINRRYVESDVKILTGLVESHFMAGASGGRKSICPGLIGEKSTFIFHGAPMLEHEKASALVLDGNPCHEESLEMARMAGADFIVNATLDHSFRLTGVFAGELDRAHRAAVEKLKSYTAFPVEKEYDAVLTHGGFVGINHYQTAKAAVEAAKILKKDGYLLLGADNSDGEIIGSLAYRTTLQLLKLVGPEDFERLIRSPDWTFIPEQWQVQMWDRLFARIPMDHFYYYSPQFSEGDYRLCPGRPMEELWAPGCFEGSLSLGRALTGLMKSLGKDERSFSAAYLSDGPYGVPERV